MFRYNIDDRQQAIRDRVTAFAQKHIAPVSKELDHRDDPDRFARDLYNALAKEGFVALRMPKEYGGCGVSSIEYTTLIEELCYHDAVACLLDAVTELATYPIYMFGTEAQKKKYVPKCASGEILPAFVLTEPDAGSDAVNQKTTAVLDGDHYVVNGEKIFIMHGDVADLFVLFAKIAGDGDDEKSSRKITAMLVEARKDGKLQPGIKVATLKKKMGMRAATTGRIWLENVRVPKENLLGEIGKGFKIAMNTLDGARIGVAAQGLGIAQRALQESIDYAKKRICFRRPDCQAAGYPVDDRRHGDPDRSRQDDDLQGIVDAGQGRKVYDRSFAGQALRHRGGQVLRRPRHADSRRLWLYRRILADRKALPRPAHYGNLRGNLGDTKAGYLGQLPEVRLKTGPQTGPVTFK